MGNFLSRLRQTDAAAAQSPVTLSRRGFLISATASGVAFGFAGQGHAAMDPSVPDGIPVSADGQTFEPTLWY